MRGLGKNCIRSNHIRERHRVLRNQLNGEKLVKEGDSRLKEWKGLKEREKEKERGEGGGRTRATEQTALSSGWSGERRKDRR